MSKARRDPRANFQSEMTPSAPRETAFERPRGVSRVETRRGFCQVHVEGLPEPLVPQRLEALAAVAEEGISIDFLKLTPHGLSFVAPADRADDLARVLGERAAVATGRSVVSIHAVNIRDEEGLLAEVVQEAIALSWLKLPI